MNQNILDKIPERSAILVIGPPLSDKKNILYKLVLSALKKDEPVLFITTDNFPSDIEKDLEKNKILFKKYEKQGCLKFLDCYSSQASPSTSDTPIVTHISGPLALNEISVALSEIESYFYKKSKKQRIIFQSLSTMLLYSKPEAIERFVQVIIAKTKNANGTIFFTIEEGMHDQKTIIGLEHLMDGIIEINKDKIKLKIIK